MGSSSESDRAASVSQLDRVELTVRRLLEAHDAWRTRAEAAESRVRELERTVLDLSEGRIDPVALAQQVRRLEEGNRSLQERLERAHAVTQRIQSRLQFVEEEA